ncbi:MAG TPA: OsmC family protein [Ktedonobacteraceae bacterium]|nr:OsmC family protein [Ktedonobacteraceae bacterium]
MTNAMTVRARLEAGMRFDVETGSGHHVILDAAEHHGGQDSGPRPMELLLVALAGCAGMDILSILRKKRQDISGYEVHIHGERAQEHPRVFVHITVEHILTGHHIRPEAVERAIELTEERYCAASAMLGKTATVQHTFLITEQGERSWPEGDSNPDT